MEYPEVDSTQVASTMLKSDDDMDLCTTDDDNDNDMIVMDVPDTYWHDDSDDSDTDGYSVDFDSDINSEGEELIATMRREGRKAEADDFRREYIYGSSMEQKTIIWPGGTHSLTDKSSGIVWVGVHGTDSICVVTRTGDLDVTRVLGYLKYHTVGSVLRKFRRTVISELEDLASPSRKLLRERLGQRIRKPFGVVSVILGTDKVHKESGHEASSNEYEEDKVMKVMPEKVEKVEKVESGLISSAEMRDQVRKFLQEENESRMHSWTTIAGHDEKNTIMYLQEQMRRDATFTINETIQASSVEYDETKAIEFLEEKLKSDSAFTVNGTIQIAISAFQHLFQKKFKANEIEVSVMDPNYFVSVQEADYKDIYVKHLEMSDIEDHLAVINEPVIGGSTITVDSSD